MASYILDTSGNISHIKYSGSWVGQVNYKPYGAASPTRLSWAPQHTTANGWHKDATNHWQTCDICEWDYDKGTHEGNWGSWTPYVYIDIDATNHWRNHNRSCISCGYTEYDNSRELHTWDTKGAWTYNASDDAKHYRTNTCICGRVGAKDSQAHGGGSTWLNNADKHYHQCSVSPTGCGHVWAVASHTWSGWVNTDPNDHWKVCTVCDRQNERAPHNHNYHYISNIYHKNNCDTCGHVFAAQETHTNDSSWHNNLAYHWHICTLCGGDANYLEHNWNEWSIHRLSYINTTHHWDNKNRNCDVCSQIQNENIRTEHTFNQYGAWNYNSSDDANHYRNKWCPCNADYTKSEKAAHDTASSWLNNADKHYYYCDTCGSPWKIQAHNWNTWSSTYTSYSDLQHYNNYSSACDQCSRINYTNTREGHTFGYTWVSKAKHNHYCGVCTWNALEAHNNDSTWHSDSGGHWHICINCGGQTTLILHTWSNTNTNVYKDATYHNFIWNNRCSVCDYNVITGTLQQHTWSTSYEKVDDNNHRRNCTAGGCTGYKIDGHNFNNYSLDDNNHRYYCLQECGFSKTIAHTIRYININNAFYHRRCCEYCNYLIDTDSHNWNVWSSWSSWIADNDNTCARTQNRHCNNCQYPQTNIQRNDHNWGAWTSYRWIDQDATYHVKTRNHTCANCTRLVYDNTTETHVYDQKGSWVYKTDTHHERYNNCICGRQGTNDTGVHDGLSVWGSNDTHHYHDCSLCLHRWGAGVHNWTTWSTTYTSYSDLQHYNNYHSSCDQCSKVNYTNTREGHSFAYTSVSRTKHNHYCSLCSWNVLEVHNNDSVWHSNAANHWHVCVDCGGEASLLEHTASYHRIDAIYHKVNCSVCSYTITAQEQHTNGSTWYYSTSKHWHECTKCGGRTNELSHDNATSRTYEQMTPTNYIWHNVIENEHCTTCGYYEIKTPYQEPHDNWIWNYYNATLHKRHCTSCGLDQTESHGSWQYRNINANNHYNNCGSCSYNVIESHVWNNVVNAYYNISNTHHNTEYNNRCDIAQCGYNTLTNVAQAHKFIINTTWHNFNNDLHYKACDLCGGYNYGDHSKVNSAWSEWSHGPWAEGPWSDWANYSDSQHEHHRTNTRLNTHTRNWSCLSCDYAYTESASARETVVQYGYADHSWGSWSDYSATQHKHICSVCSTTQYASHTWGSWTSYVYTMINADNHLRSRNHTCTVSTCGHVGYDDTIEAHDLQDTQWSAWTYNSTTDHRRDRDRPCYYCEYVKGETQYESHSWSGWSSWSSWTSVNSTNHNRQRTNNCTVCGYVKYDNQTGTHGSWTYSPYNSNQHWKNCGVCNYTSKVDHTWSSWSGWSAWTADGPDTHSRNNSRYCTTSGCGFIQNLVQTDSHSPDINYNYDSTNHWKDCLVCGYQMNVTAHTLNYYDVDDQQHIAVCEFIEGGVQVGCGYQDYQTHTWVPDYSKPDIYEPKATTDTKYNTYHNILKMGYCSLCGTYGAGQPVYVGEERHTGTRNCTLCGWSR